MRPSRPNVLGEPPSSALAALSRLRLRRFGTPRPRRSYSLHFSIGTLFSTLIVVLGAALILHGFERHRALALDAAAELFGEIARGVAGDAAALYAPIEALIEQTARLNVGSGASIDELPLSVGYFAEALVSHPQLDAIYVGFDDGDFFLVRQAPAGSAAHAALAAPEGTAFVVQRVERDRFEQPLYVTSFVDEALEPIAVVDDLVTGFDPRTRPWYRDADAIDGTVVTDFYRFFTSGEIGATLARRARGGNAVIGADVRLETISESLRSPSLPTEAEVVVFTADGELVGYDDAAWLERRTRRAMRGQRRSPEVGDIGQPELDALFERFVAGERDARMTLDTGRGAWFGTVAPIAFGAHGADSVHVAILAPERSLLAGQRAVRLQSTFLSVLVLAVAVAGAWWLSASIARSARELEKEALGIRRLELDGPVTVRSRVREIDRLAHTMDTMKSALQRFVRLTEVTGSTPELDTLARRSLEQIAAACGASSATLLLRSDDGRRLVRVAEILGIDPLTGRDAASDFRSDAVPLPAATASPPRLRPEQHAALRGESVVVGDVGGERDHDVSGYRSRASLSVPLATEHGGVVGVVHLGDPGRRDGGREPGLARDTLVLVEALAAHAAMAFENQRLNEARRDSFEALVRMLAKAIDAKSPHTGRHCQRVPILTRLLAEAAHESDAPPFRDYRLDEGRRHELDVATWLHDCGKVTTPEHVLDKATRLETVHNRIHEIRTRFEVLWRDAEILCLRTIAENPVADREQARRRRDETQSRLQEEFAFIAACNLGSTPIGPEQARRVHEIAGRTWSRHFDDTLGLSPAELARHAPPAERTLPATEPLLADKPIHRVERVDEDRSWGENRFGFERAIPPCESDAGEIHNLLVPRGTLTPEERFRIEDHVAKTIEMLDAIPFPRELARVPSIAGNHHERLDGTGYPRGLDAAELGIEDRILAIADVFEALTAADRPYRRALTLEGSITIMRGMCDRGELCPDLFELFIERKLHLAYAERLREGADDTIPHFHRPRSATREALAHDID